jgi:hypothetical protein
LTEFSFGIVSTAININNTTQRLNIRRAEGITKGSILMKGKEVLMKEERVAVDLDRVRVRIRIQGNVVITSFAFFALLADESIRG